MENRHGLLVDFQVTTATGTAERDVVPQLIDAARQRGFHPRTLGADKGYDTRDFVQTLRAQGVTPTLRKTRVAAAAQSTDGRPTGLAMTPVKRCADASKKSSAGSKR